MTSDAVDTAATLLAVDPLGIDIIEGADLGLQRVRERGDGVGGEGLRSGQDPGLLGVEDAEPVVAAVNERVAGVVGVENLVVTLREPQELHVAVTLIVAPGEGDGPPSTEEAGVAEHAWVGGFVVAILHDNVKVKEGPWLGGVSSGDAGSALLIPHVLVSLDLVPVACVLLDVEVADGGRPLPPEGAPAPVHGCLGGCQERHSRENFEHSL